MTAVPLSVPAEGFSLSPGQESLWFLEQTGQAGSAYGMPFALRLRGRLDPEALRRSCQAIVDGDPILRTTYVLHDGRPRMLVGPIAPVSFEERDLEPGQAWEPLFEELCRLPFDLARGPLIRFRLVRTGEDSWVLMVNVHHLVFDNKSKLVFLRRLARAYGGEHDIGPGQRSPVPGPSPVSPAALDDDIRAIDPGVQSLPLDFERPPVWSARGDAVRWHADGDLRAGIERLAVDGVTPFQVLFSAFAAFVARHTGEPRATVTVAMGIRGADEQEEIGFYANNVPVTVDVTGTASFRVLVAHARQRARSASRRRHVPLPDLVQLVNPVRYPGVIPLFQVGMTYVRPDPPVGLPGVETEVDLYPPNYGAKCDLRLAVADFGSHVDGHLEFATDLFARRTVERLGSRFSQFLGRLLDRPDDPLGQLPILSGDDWDDLRTWNSTTTSPPTRWLHERFADEAARLPAQEAVADGEGSMSYAALDEASRRVAAHLQGLGVGPERLVAVACERRVTLLVALLGVMRAGGAYLALDPSHPRARLSYILSDSKPEVVIGDRHLLEGLPGLDVPMACVDDLVSAPPPGDWSPPAVKADNAIYVMYTSGSTGRPKGTVVQHANVANLLTAVTDVVGLAGDDRWLALASAAFDMSVPELWAPLVVGATVVLGQEELLLDGVALAGAIDRHDITVLEATPTTWSGLLATGWHCPPRLRGLIGAEALPLQLAKELVQRGVAPLWNLYGPTETTVWSTVWPVSGAVDQLSRVLIGRPLANTTVVVVDDQGQAVPPGVAGTLAIGGAGVSRGYLNRPRLTAERFGPDWIGPSSGGRLYDTGDRVRFTATGDLEYRGRGDAQVKLRGVRIELGEVESLLESHPEVGRAGVVVQDDPTTGPVLVAYLVAQPGGPAPVPSDLRLFLSRQVPSTMVPSRFVAVDELPLTPTGKIDRRNLAARPLPVAAESAHRPPATPEEKALVEIWSELLGTEDVGCDDNFFDLGGHSLLATQVAARIRSRFGVDVPLAAVFERPTIAGLADAIAGDGFSPTVLEVRSPGR